MPIITIVSCNHEVKTITKEALNKEAKALEKKNFYYDEKTFDTAKDISTYDDAAKVSGSALSDGTKLIASKLAASGTKLTITYTLKNGNESSDKQTFTYPGFIAKGDSRVTILKVTTIPINAVSSSNKSPVDIATLVTEDQAKNDIATKHLKYTIVSAIKADVDVKDDFEIINSTLKLKALQELTIGSVEFIISVKLKSGDSLTIRAAPFTVTIKS